MPYVMVHHKVQDYAKWKVGFDDHASMRKGAGSKGGYLFQNADDPNDVVVFLEWDDLEVARKFVVSDDVRNAMEGAGVIGPPTIVFLNEAGRPAN